MFRVSFTAALLSQLKIRPHVFIFVNHTNVQVGPTVSSSVCTSQSCFTSSY